MVAILEKLKLSLNRGTESILFAKIAEESRAKGEVKKALKVCEDGIGKFPNYATGHYILARCYLEEEMNTEAKESLAEALKFAPHHIAALTELASLYQIENNSSQALHYYRQALAIDPLNERIESLIQSISGEPGPAATIHEIGKVESSEPIENIAETTVVEPPGIEQLQPSLPTDTFDTSDEGLPVASSEPEDLLNEENSVDFVAPTAPPFELPHGIGRESVTVAEVDPGIEISAQGIWVSEMFSENVPRPSAIDGDGADGGEPWPATLFSSLMELGTRTDMVTFGGGPMESMRKSSAGGESDIGLGNAYAFEEDLIVTDPMSNSITDNFSTPSPVSNSDGTDITASPGRLNAEDGAQSPPWPTIEDGSSANPDEDSPQIEDESEEEVPFWTISEANDEAISPQIESPESVASPPDTAIPDYVDPELKVDRSQPVEDVDPDSEERADPTGATGFLHDSTVESDDAGHSSQLSDIAATESQADSDSDDEESKIEYVGNPSDSPSLNEDPFTEEMDEPPQGGYSEHASNGAEELDMDSDFRSAAAAPPPTDHISESNSSDHGIEPAPHTESSGVDEDDSIVEDRQKAEDTSEIRVDARDSGEEDVSERYLDQFFTDSFSFPKVSDSDATPESLNSVEEHSPPETLSSQEVPAPASGHHDGAPPTQPNETVIESSEEIATSEKTPDIGPDPQPSSVEDSGQIETVEFPEAIDHTDDKISDASLSVPDDRIDETPPEEATGQSTVSPRDPRSEAIPTATLAELYVRQGLLDRAIAVYLTLIEHDPTNPDIHKRLSELFVIKSQGGRS
ncbi:MAG: hypothetical protein HOH43_06155 [Candidatus Latescibacteria bacterium]|nr:hypothetical protein [Candidatus Latescibacterota bacterium]